MHKSLATLLEIALIGGGLALATAGCGGDGETDTEDTGATEDTDAGCPTGGCPTAEDTGAAM